MFESLKELFREHPKAVRNTGFVLSCILGLLVLASLMLGGIPFAESMAFVTWILGVMTAAGHIFLTEEPLTWQKQESLLYEARAALCASPFSAHERDMLASQLVKVHGLGKTKSDIAGLGRMISRINILGSKDPQITEIIKEINIRIQRLQEEYPLEESLTTISAIEYWAKWLQNPTPEKGKILNMLNSTNRIPERIFDGLDSDTVDKLEFFFSKIRCDDVSGDAQVSISKALENTDTITFISSTEYFITWMKPKCERIFIAILEQLERPDVPRKLRRRFLATAQKTGFVRHHYQFIESETLEEALNLSDAYRYEILIGRLHGQENHSLQIVFRKLDPEENEHVEAVLTKLSSLTDQYAEYAISDFLSKSNDERIPDAVLQEALNKDRQKNFRKTYFQYIGELGFLKHAVAMHDLVTRETDEVSRWMKDAIRVIEKREGPPFRTL